jgi:integrase
MLTAARAGEVLRTRGIDLETTDPTLWVYTPAGHKTEWRGLDRKIYLGPKAIAILKGFLRPETHAFLFSPRDAVEDLHRRRSERRMTRRTPSEARRRRKQNPLRTPRDRYDRNSYRQAIVRACERASVPAFSPLQLRHLAATRIRAEHGLEAAQVVLGHRRADVSQLYAERDERKAGMVMRASG